MPRDDWGKATRKDAAKRVLSEFAREMDRRGIGGKASNHPGPVKTKKQKNTPLPQAKKIAAPKKKVEAKRKKPLSPYVPCPNCKSKVRIKNLETHKAMRCPGREGQSEAERIADPMSRKLFAFLLSELQTVRVICARGKCGGVVELPVSNLYSVGSARCPKCGEHFDTTGQEPNRFSKLKQAIEDALSEPDRFSIEFVIPDKGE